MGFGKRILPKLNLVIINKEGLSCSQDGNN